LKTSLVIDEALYQAAKREALRIKTSISTVISLWARQGRDKMRKEKKNNRFEPVDLGGRSSIDLSRRKDWLEYIEDVRKV
jgi:hypothetical protein